MLGKCMTQVLRLSAILQALENCFKIASDLKSLNKFILNESIEKEVDHIIQNSKPIVNISLLCLNNAKKLLSYFNLNRLVMAGYKYNFALSTNELSVQNIIECLVDDKSIDSQLAKGCKVVLEAEGLIVNSTKISQKFRIPINVILKAFEYLESKKLGEVTSSNKLQSQSGPKNVKNFTKVTILEIEQNLSLIKEIEGFNVSMVVYSDSFGLNNNNNNILNGNLQIIFLHLSFNSFRHFLYFFNLFILNLKFLFKIF